MDDKNQIPLSPLSPGETTPVNGPPTQELQTPVLVDSSTQQVQPSAIASPTTNSNNAATFNPINGSKPKWKKHKLRLGLIGIVAIIVIGFGALTAFNQNFRANLFRDKFERYTFTYKGYAFSLLYYRDSVIGWDAYSSGENVPQYYLIAPDKDNGGYPLEIQMGGIALPSSPSQTPSTNIINKLSSCTIGPPYTYKVAFSTYIKSINATTNVCSVYISPNKQNPNFYITAFKSINGNLTYIVEFEQEFSDASAKSASQSAEGIDGNLNISTYQNDIKQILGSIQPLSS
jgi:hypothetical protein